MQTNPSLTHIPPQALELEESILSSCLMGDAEEAIELLLPEDFYRTAHQKIFSAIGDLQRQNVEVDLPSLVSTMRDAGQLEKVGGAHYLARFIDKIPIATNIVHYARKIKDKAILRRLIADCNYISKACFEGSDNIETVLDDAQKRILSIGYMSATDTTSSYRDLSLEASDRYEELYRQKGSITGIRSGFYLLDATTCGFQNSDLIIIAARPSMGKTAIALNMAGNIARSGIPAAIFSLEMSKQQLFDRQVAGESGVNSQKFRSGKFDQTDWQDITDAQSKIYGWPVFIDDTPALNYLEITRRARRLKNRHGIQIVFVDHLQLIKGDKSPSRDREIGSITGGLKALAKELDIPIVLLSQLNRKLEDRHNPKKRPVMSDLRDSGNIEQDADVIAFLYRPAVYEDLEEFEGHAELLVAKQRNGPTGKVKLIWHERTTTFSNLDSRH